MKKEDDFKNASEVEVEQLSNTSETDEPERLEETEKPTVLRSAVLCLVTIGILAILIGLGIFLFNKTTKKPADDVANNEEVTQQPAVEEVEDKPAVDTKPEEVVVQEPAKEEEPEVAEPEPEDGEVDFSQYSIPKDLANAMDYDELKIIVWNNEKGGQAILSDGDSYELEKGDMLYLYYPQDNLNITVDESVCSFDDYGTNGGIYISAAGENIEAMIKAVAPDGTEYEITVYITKDFEGIGLF